MSQMGQSSSDKPSDAYKAETITPSLLSYAFNETKQLDGMAGACIAQRRSHQDAAVIFKVPREVAGLPSERIMQGLAQTAKDMSEQDAKKDDCGACVSFVMGQLKDGNADIYQFSAGDSLSMALVFDEKNNYIPESGVMLNQRLHHPSEDSEFKRIGMENLINVHGVLRIGGQIMVSRAFGDHRFNNSGLSNEAEQCHVEIPVLPGHRVVIVNASDALLDRFHFNRGVGLDTVINGLGKEVEKGLKAKAGPDKIAENLTAFAKMGERPDDSTFAVMFLDNTMRGSLVADGHGVGGEKVAERLVENCTPRLAAQMNLQLEEHQKEQPAKEQKEQKEKRPDATTALIAEAKKALEAIEKARNQKRFPTSKLIDETLVGLNKLVAKKPPNLLSIRDNFAYVIDKIGSGYEVKEAKDFLERNNSVWRKLGIEKLMRDREERETYRALPRFVHESKETKKESDKEAGEVPHAAPKSQR